MIWDSEPWKKELSETIVRIDENGKGLLQRDGELGDTDVLIERDLLTSAFIVRKLWDSLKLSIQAELQSVAAVRHPLFNADVFPDSTNWERLDNFYDLFAAEDVELDLRQVVNQLIHSYILLTIVGEDEPSQGYKLTGFFCASDTARRKGVYQIPWENYRKCLEVVAQDGVASSHMVRNGRGGSVELRSAELLTKEEIAKWEADRGVEIENLMRQHQEFIRK